MVVPENVSLEEAAKAAVMVKWYFSRRAGSVGADGQEDGSVASLTNDAFVQVIMILQMNLLLEMLDILILDHLHM
jgi:hypothetical protein